MTRTALVLVLVASLAAGAAPSGGILTSRRTYTQSTRHFAKSFAAAFNAGQRASLPLALGDDTEKQVLGGIAVEVRVR